jgi:ATP-dependent helicase/nuclease subunit B
MLRITTGPFHPDLESALVEDVRRLRHDDPFGPAAIIVPSAHLLSRVRELLVLEAGLPLLNVHFLTFHQLALRLRDERHTNARAESATKDDPFPHLDLVEDFFFQCLLGQITTRDVPQTAALRLATASPGGQAALWTTIRDLKDSAIDPAVASRALAEGLFDADDAPKLQALFTVYAAVLEASRTLGIGGIDDLASMVTPWACDSRFLGALRGVWYYGFYDLTQVQLSFFEAVTRSAPVTLLFPLEDQPAYDFARRFLERHLLPLMSSSDKITRAGRVVPTDRAGDRLEVQIMSAVGPEDELTLVCKEILTLVETHGYQFDDIGVVARGLQPYHAFLRRVFDEHRIPFTSTAVAPVISYPAAKVFLQLAWLPLTRFSRRAVLDLLSSPFYRFDFGMTDQSLQGVRPRPDLWQLAVGELGILGGESDWQRLKSVGSLDASVGDVEDEGHPDTINIPVAQLRLLWHLVSGLIESCHALPRQGTMVELAEAFITLASKHLQLPGPVEQRGGDDSADILVAVIRHALDRLQKVDDIVGSVSWQEWTSALTHLAEQAVIPLELTNPDSAGRHRGVQVLDAMAARGLPFRALFVLGLNEKVFPRFIREDAFLRDRQRRVLDQTLGYKIDEKLTGYDEEQLLFGLLRGATRQRLYLSYQRADTDGRPLAPSPYLPQSGQILHLPRRFSDRAVLPQFARMLLTREELALRLVLDGHDPSTLLTAMGRNAALFQNGIAALLALEGPAHELGPYDALVGPLPGHWERLTARGVAPTSLEDYARCPTRYFAKHVLRLEPRQLPMDGLPAHGWGSLAHSSLRECYECLVKHDWPAIAMGPAELRHHAASAVEEACAAYAAHHGTGHPLLWDIAKETLVALVAAMLELDQEDYRVNGYRPIAFEVEAEGLLDGLGPDLNSLKVHGRLDRVDLGPSSSIRVVDYKFKLGRKMNSIDRDLLASAIRGFRLQPPLYALMKASQGQSGDADAITERIEFRFLAPQWETVVDRSEFDAGIWHAPDGDRLRGTLKTLLQGLRAGSYVMLPAEDYCEYCEFSAACRRFHDPSWWRAHRASAARALRLLRKQKPEPSKTQQRRNGATTGD